MPRLRILPLLALGLVALSMGCGGDSFENAAAGAAGDGGVSDASDASDAFEASADVAVEDAVPDGAGDGPPEDGAEEADTGPGELPLGASCGPGDTCQSAHCIDGVCCEAACGPCLVCNLPGSEGLCSPAPLGANPHDACGPPGDPCAGQCDGAGACLYDPAGDACGPTSCAPSGVDLITPSCDGAGACADVTTSCGPYRCDEVAGECHVDCASSTDICTPNAFCDGAACQFKFADGTVCSAANQCMSDLCVDGVCCATACDGVCEHCALSGSQGTCAPIPDTTDPEGECVGADSTCSGACDGMGACSFPGASQSCGAPVCDTTNNAQQDSLCDGQGGCEVVPKDCKLFLCDGTTGVCPASCANDLACIDTAYCQAPACKAKQDNGAACTAPNQCTSGFCESIPATMQKRCCNTLCPSPLNCSTGECLCSTVTCTPGVACVTWFQDWDRDTFGDPTVMLVGCEDTPPVDASGHAFVRNSQDCYDNNANAKPGQTALYGMHRGDFSFDYNCDNQETKEYDDTLPAGASQCQDCNASWNCVNCGYLNTFWITHGYTCNTPCGPKQLRGFKGTTSCGQTRTLFECINVANQCTNAENTIPGTIQRCN